MTEYSFFLQRIIVKQMHAEREECAPPYEEEEGTGPLPRVALSPFPEYMFSTPEYLKTQTYVEKKLWDEIFEHTCPRPFDTKLTYVFVVCYYLCMKQSPNLSTKYRILAKLFTNPFYTDNMRHSVLQFVQKAQRAYFAMIRFMRIVQFRRTKVQIDCDLYMNELVHTKRSTFVLLDHQRLYYFSLSDLHRIITEALTYSYLFWSEPLVCKNPYTNIPFSKSTLYNIYFAMRDTWCIVPKFIQLFFEADFNIFRFKRDNETLLREHIVREYVSKTTPEVLYPEIKRLIRIYDVKRRLSIDPEFPKSELAKTLKPYIVLYYLRKHTLDTFRREYYTNELQHTFSRFIRYNPTFGRRIVHVSSQYSHAPRSGMQGEPFHFVKSVGLPSKRSNRDFMRNHQYNEILYNRYTQYGVLRDSDVSDVEEDWEEEEEADVYTDVSPEPPPPPPSVDPPPRVASTYEDESREPSETGSEDGEEETEIYEESSGHESGYDTDESA